MVNLNTGNRIHSGVHFCYDAVSVQQAGLKTGFEIASELRSLRIGITCRVFVY